MARGYYTPPPPPLLVTYGSNFEILIIFSQNGLVLYGQWITNDNLVLDIPQLSNKQVTLYLLKEGEPGNLESATSRLNDQEILWDTHLPVANLRGNHTSLPITLPPYSQFFIVLGSDQSKSK